MSFRHGVAYAYDQAYRISSKLIILLFRGGSVPFIVGARDLEIECWFILLEGEAIIVPTHTEAYNRVEISGLRSAPF